jgi:hypothetical protein
MNIRVRSGNATATSDWFWTKIWLKMMKTIEHLLPDMDIALNAMDEPRIVVPWEDMAEYMAKAAKTRTMTDARSAVSEFQSLAPVPNGADKNKDDVPKKSWENTSRWHYPFCCRTQSYH